MKDDGPMTGFTLIELLVVISIIGILLTVSFLTNRNMQSFAADTERTDDTAAIARRLEQAYTNQEIGSPSYPSTAEILNDASNRTRTLQGISVDALRAPFSTSSSLVAASSTSQTDPYPGMSSSDYVYQPLTRYGSLCNADPSSIPESNNCVSFTLFYKLDVGGSLMTVRSVHQQ